MAREKNIQYIQRERERKRGGGAKEQADTGETMTRTSICVSDHTKPNLLGNPLPLERLCHFVVGERPVTQQVRHPDTRPRRSSSGDWWGSEAPDSRLTGD